MRYYIYIDNEVKGPHTIDELISMKLASDTHLCVEGKDEWITVNDIPELKNSLENASSDIHSEKENQQKENLKVESEIFENEETFDNSETSDNTDNKPVVKKRKKKIIIFSLIAIFSLLLLISITGFFILKNSSSEPESLPFVIDENFKSIWQPGLLLFAAVDVGQGDGLVIITPHKKVIVIDAGSGSNYYRKTNYGARMVTFLEQNNIDKIDLIIVTHCHEDHLGGVPTVIDKIETVKVMEPGLAHTSSIYKRLLTMIKTKNIEYEVAKKGKIIQIDDEVSFEILNDYQTVQEKASRINNSSVVVRLDFKNVSVMLTGDIETKLEKRMVDEKLNLKSTILKSPHHGSSTSSSNEFIKAVNPDFFIISAGRNNKHAHPSKSVLDNYMKYNKTLLRTDIHGTIEFLTDGNTIKYRTAKTPANPEDILITYPGAKRKSQSEDSDS